MKKKIWKYIIGLYGETHEIPTGAKILSCDVVNGYICVYALVDPENGLEERTFRVYLTGEEIDFNDGLERRFIGTCKEDGFVYHLFELI